MREASSIPVAWNPSPARLSLAEREEIRVGVERGNTFTAIAARIGRAVSTVSREVAANGGRDAYQGWHAHQQAGCRARRPKTTKLAHPPLAAQVTGLLEEWWSPEEISLWLRIEFPDDPMMQVSHETIYQSLFVQGARRAAPGAPSLPSDRSCSAPPPQPAREPGPSARHGQHQ